MAADVAETARIERPPRGREEAPVVPSRLLDAHQVIIEQCRELAERSAKVGDQGTNDMLSARCFGGMNCSHGLLVSTGGHTPGALDRNFASCRLAGSEIVVREAGGAPSLCSGWERLGPFTLSRFPIKRRGHHCHPRIGNQYRGYAWPNLYLPCQTSRRQTPP